MKAGMKVTPISGERFRYYVHSASEEDAEHIVDLTENGGNGACSCRYFEVTCGPNLRNHKAWVHYGRDEKGKVLPGVTQCKHIALVRNYLLDSILPDLIKQVEHKRPKPVTVREGAGGLPF